MEGGELTHSRFEAVDLAKLIAAAAVVWIHVTNCDDSRAFLPLCRFAVPFFTCVAVYFVLHKVYAHQVPFGTYCLERARRLYVPFMLWSGVYLGARLLKHAVVGFGQPVVFSPAVFLNGTAHHLWFLPFICLVSIITYGLARSFPQPSAPHRRWWVLGCFIAGIAWALTPCPIVLHSAEFPLSYFIDHAWEAVPAAFFGAALFWLLSDFRPETSQRWTVLGIGAAIVVAEFFSDGHPILPNLAGASLLFFTTTQPNRNWTTALWPWAQLAFLIYLVHVLFVEALQTVVMRFDGTRSLSADLSVWALALLVSALAARGLLRFEKLKWAFPR